MKMQGMLQSVCHYVDLKHAVVCVMLTVMFMYLARMVKDKLGI